MLDLTEQDFLNISNVTGRVFEMGVQRSEDSIHADVCPNSTFLSSSMAGKHVWLNANSVRDVTERLRHFHSAFSESPTSTSACVLVRESMPVHSFAIVKGFSSCSDGSKGRIGSSVAGG